MKSHETRTAFKESGRIVIVGASLAGLRAAEALPRRRIYREAIPHW